MWGILSSYLNVLVAVLPDWGDSKKIKKGVGVGFQALICAMVDVPSVVQIQNTNSLAKYIFIH